MAYCDYLTANQHISAGVFSAAWEALAENEAVKYIESASRMIEYFCIFYDDDGVPFAYDDAETDLPDWLKIATAEQALYLVNLGKDPTQADKKTTLGILSTDGTVFDKRFSAAVLCQTACRLIEANGGEISPVAKGGGAIGFGRVVK